MSIADDTSVLLQFASLLDVASFIQEYRDIQQPYFQVQFLNTDIDRKTCVSVLSYYQTFCRRLNHQHRSEIINGKRSKFEEAQISKDREIFKMKKRKLDKENYAKIICTPEHEKHYVRGSSKQKIKIKKKEK